MHCNNGKNKSSKEQRNCNQENDRLDAEDGGRAETIPAMASSEVSEVSEAFSGFGGDDLRHVDDVHGLSMPVECVQEVVAAAADDAVVYGGEELVVDSGDVPQSEEVVSAGAVVAGAADPLLDSIPVPSPSPFTGADPAAVAAAAAASRRRRPPPKGKRRAPLAPEISPPSPDGLVLDPDADGSLSPPGKTKSTGGWQQQQVSIKTLEGEFSVTMWASGTDEGRMQRMIEGLQRVTFGGK